MPMITRVDHLNVQVPPEREQEAKAFYGELLGLKELTKPENLGSKGAHYLVCDTPWTEIHLGVSREDNNEATNRSQARHLGFQVADLAAARKAFLSAGVAIEEAEPATSTTRGFCQHRFFVRDPGGNRLEILEPR